MPHATRRDVERLEKAEALLNEANPHLYVGKNDKRYRGYSLFIQALAKITITLEDLKGEERK